MSTTLKSIVLNEQAGRQRPGHVLEPHQSVDAWVQKAGMDWTIKEAPVQFMTGQGEATQSLQAYDCLLYTSPSPRDS